MAMTATEQLLRDMLASGDITPEQRRALAAYEAQAIAERVLAEKRDRDDRAAMRHALQTLIGEMVAISLANAEKRDAFADRIAKLEAQITHLTDSAEPRLSLVV